MFLPQFPPGFVKRLLPRAAVDVAGRCEEGGLEYEPVHDYPSGGSIDQRG
jgi:hypothetical protein